MKTLLYFYLLFVVVGVEAQESLSTNYFKSINVSLIGEVDSLFQVDFEVFKGEQSPRNYEDYVFDKNGNILYYMQQNYGAYSYNFVDTEYKDGSIDYELINALYGDVDTNKFQRDSKGRVVRISNSERFIEIEYDKNSRISQKIFGYVADGFQSRKCSYRYTTADTYTETTASGDNVYAVSEFIKGRKKLEALDLVLGGSDITTYEYNDKGDLSMIDIVGPYTDLIMKFEYEYDDRGNWVKKTGSSQYKDEKELSVSDISTRKLIYSDGHVTGYEVQY